MISGDSRGVRHGELSQGRDAEIGIADRNVCVAAPAIDDVRRLAFELGPDRVEGTAQKAAVRAAPLELGTAIAELEREPDIWRHVGQCRVRIFCAAR